jgi:hypothetical protein
MASTATYERTHRMQDVLAQRVQALLGREPARSIFRCPECGSFFDAVRLNPETGRPGRKCVACNEWHLPSGAGRKAGSC